MSQTILGVRKTLLLAASTASLTVAFFQGAQGKATLLSPSLEVRFSNAKAIRSQPWYASNASLLDDVSWQRDGSLIFRNRTEGQYQKLGVEKREFITLVSFRRLGQMLRGTDGVDLQTVDQDIQAPVEFGDSAVIIGNGGMLWSCGFSSQKCAPRAISPFDAMQVNRAPNRSVGLIIREGNLHLVKANSPKGLQLTVDGGDRIVYGSARSGREDKQPMAVWSSDGRYAVVSRLDQSRVGHASMIEWLPDGKFGSRSRLSSRPRVFFGDVDTGERTLHVIDTKTGEMIHLPDSTAKDITADPVESGFVQFSDDDHRVYYIRQAEDFRSARLIEFDPRTRSSRTVLAEETRDGGFLYFSGQRNPAAFRVLRHQNGVVWYSERDGYGHLYLHELASGKLLRQLTRGNWTVLSIVRVQDDRIYFLGTSAEYSGEPYNHQLYSISLDTQVLEQHTERGRDHAFSWPAVGDLFVQSSASIDVPATLAVRSIGRLASAPLRFGLPASEVLTKIRGTGFRGPSRFRIESKIGNRTVFGTVYFPNWMTPGHKLPVIEKIYPGYCCIPSPWAFPHERGGRFSVPRFFEPQALAELGFVVVITAGPGSPLRGRAYHQAQRGEGYWDADSLETHMDVLRHLALSYPQMDLLRVGIYGHSGGGYAAARAILKYPEFYQVAVALSGNHDRRLYDASWPAMYAGHDPNAMGAREGPENVTLARNLQGHLLLMHGDRDSAVLIDSTMQLAAALQQARKKFDLQVIIGGRHGIDSDDYVQEYYWSYFLEHLRGERIGIDLEK